MISENLCNLSNLRINCLEHFVMFRVDSWIASCFGQKSTIHELHEINSSQRRSVYLLPRRRGLLLFGAGFAFVSVRFAGAEGAVVSGS